VDWVKRPHCWLTYNETYNLNVYKLKLPDIIQNIIRPCEFQWQKKYDFAKVLYYKFVRCLDFFSFMYSGIESLKEREKRVVQLESIGLIERQARQAADTEDRQQKTKKDKLFWFGRKRKR
jgi:hypothetical protein